jgi:hypothetical protein
VLDTLVPQLHCNFLAFTTFADTSTLSTGGAADKQKLLTEKAAFGVTLPTTMIEIKYYSSIISRIRDLY